MFQRAIAIAWLVTTLAACSPGTAVVDTSSTEAFQNSLAKMREGMDPSQAERFQGALMAVAMKDLGDAMATDGLAGLTTFAAMNSDPASMMARIAPLISGKNVAEVIEVGDSVVANRAARQLAAVESEIATLQAELALIEQEQEGVGDFLQLLAISNTRFRMNDDSFMREPVIEVTISNGTGKAIRRVYFRGTLETPGRSVPWVDADFNYEIPGGIENGETLPLALAPNMYSDWGNRAHTERTDTVLTVEVVDLEFADGTRVQSTPSGEIETKQNRLERLLAQQAELLAKSL